MGKSFFFSDTFVYIYEGLVCVCVCFKERSYEAQTCLEIHYIPKGGLELSILLLGLSSALISGMCHHHLQFFFL